MTNRKWVERIEQFSEKYEQSGYKNLTLRIATTEFEQIIRHDEFLETSNPFGYVPSHGITKDEMDDVIQKYVDKADALAIYAALIFGASK